MSIFKRMKEWMETRYEAAAFAEANDHKTAREVARTITVGISWDWATLPSSRACCSFRWVGISDFSC